VKGPVVCGKPTWLPQILLSLANSTIGLRSSVLCCPLDVLRSDFKCLPEAISGRSVQFAASLACYYLWFRSCNRAAIAPRRTASSTGPDKYSWAQSVNRSALVQMWLEHPDQEPCWSYPQSWKTMTNGMRCCFALLLSFHLIPRPSSFKCHMRTVGGRIVITRWSPVHTDAQRDCNSQVHDSKYNCQQTRRRPAEKPTRTTTGNPADMKFECCLLAIRKTCWGSDTRVFRNVLPNRFGSRAFRSQAELELCGAPKQATCNTLPFAFMRLCPFGFVYGILLIKSPACRVVSSREAAAKGIGQGSNLESRRVVPQLLS